MHSDTESWAKTIHPVMKTYGYLMKSVKLWVPDIAMQAGPYVSTPMPSLCIADTASFSNVTVPLHPADIITTPIIPSATNNISTMPTATVNMQTIVTQAIPCLATPLPNNHTPDTRPISSSNVTIPGDEMALTLP